MNGQPQPEQPNQEQKPKDPLRDLVANLTPDTSAKLKGFLLPPQTGLMFAIGVLIYRVSAINAGQLRFSAEFYGIRTEDGRGIIRPGGKIEYGPPPKPKPHEVGRNPNNVTLDVQSGSLDGTAIFKPRAANGQNPVE